MNNLFEFATEFLTYDIYINPEIYSGNKERIVFGYLNKKIKFEKAKNINYNVSLKNFHKINEEKRQQILDLNLNKIKNNDYRSDIPRLEFGIKNNIIRK